MKSLTLCPYRADEELLTAVMFYLTCSAMPLRINARVSLISIEDGLVKCSLKDF